jgi:hypothetical protein
MHQAGNLGFLSLGDNMAPQENIMQWNRFRAALFTLFKMSGDPDVLVPSTEMMISWIKTECEATLLQCSKGPTSSSNIFNEDVISEENVPPGLFIQCSIEILERALSLRTPVVLMSNLLRVLIECRHSVISVIISQCPSPVNRGSFHDPRPVIAETWFLCMVKLSLAVATQGSLTTSDAGGDNCIMLLKRVLLDSFVAAISLLFYPSLEKTQERRSLDPGMTLDGPQGLVMMDFFESFFNLGPIMIQAAAQELVSIVPVDEGRDKDASGMAIIGAALFRGSQGGLPPWAVESIPSVYSSLFRAMNKNVDDFNLLLDLSMTLRLYETQHFGSVRGGTLLAGKFFEKMSDKTRGEFLNQARELAGQDNVTAWKRLKFLIKQVCGGKKKDTDYNQRPALTRWDTLDRV